MARLEVLLVVASACHCIAVGPAGGVPYHAETHEPVKSTGCGKESPYKAGMTSVAQANYLGITWTYRIYVPHAYDVNTPMPVILQHPGWGVSAKYEERGAGITDYADDLGFISVTPQGADDNPNSGGPWYSWNAGGTSRSPGPAGATCTEKANAPSYCYTSCSPCTDKPQCDWTTCDDTVTPTGTGTGGNVDGYIPRLYDTLEEQLCIDTTREFAAGESNGGIMTYQLGVDLASRLAAIAPQFGSFHRGFNMAPSVGVPLIDLHGKTDTVIPANVSLSGDGYYYTPVKTILNGDEYSRGWKAANNCSGESSHYKMKYDNVDELWCVLVGNCSGGDIVHCAYKGGHDWFDGGGKANGGLVTEFLLKWKKPSHIGRGYSIGEPLGQGQFLENVTILDLSLGGADPSSAAPHRWKKDVLEPVAHSHYGNPALGCLEDEDVIPAGTGHVCAPKIGTVPSASSPPTPACIIGGVVPSHNNCPGDASVPAGSKAWPICLAKGNGTDGYNRGEFHCLLVCPCDDGMQAAGSTCAHAQLHCPVGARCERGELRKRDQGVCTYPFQSKPNSIVV